MNTELIAEPSRDLKADHSRVIPKERRESHLSCLLQACPAKEDLSGAYISFCSAICSGIPCGQVVDSGLAPPAGTVKGLEETRESLT